MTHLAKALKKYYSKEGNKLIFRNKYSLNQLALEMWERMGYQGIDASVLSRVISGERLFTSIQLKTFCHTLNLDLSQSDDLYHVLSLDRTARYGQDLINNFIPNYDTVDFIDSLLVMGKQYLDKGRYH